MKRQNLEQIYKLSPMQHGMLFHTLRDADIGMYIEQLSFTLSNGKLSVEVFKQAWEQVVARHAALRTSFHWEDIANPVQVVHRHVELPWAVEDWRGLPPSMHQEQIETYLTEDKRRGFELSKAPLMRVALIRLTDDTYQCVWTHHHIVLDGWSVALLLKEILAFYEAYSSGKELRLLRPRPYQDYISWLMRQEMFRADDFWRQSLKGITSPTPLGIDRKIEILSGQKDYDEQHLLLSRSLTEELKNLARRHQLTLNTLVQGAWAVLLSRYSGEEDVVYGSVVSGRPGELFGVESMVGLFINTLPVRVRVSPEAPFVSWLKMLQERQVELRQYEHSPLVQVQGASEVPRGLSLFESIVVFENYPMDGSFKDRKPGEGLEISNVQMFERTNYPLSIAAVPGEELLLSIMYDCGRFDVSAIARMLGHFQTLLSGMAADPKQRLSDLSVLAEGERRQLLVDWNDTKASYPKDRCIHELFEEQVEKTPDAVAVVFEDQKLSYRELNSRTNQLAHYLQDLGVGPEVLVGICVERSLEMIVGLLGILKAGGAYVPLDPAYPRERISFMLEDAGLAVLLTQERLVHDLPEHHAKLVRLDTEWGVITRKSRKNPAKKATSENIAYVIYTSGSTGQPKGVQVFHQSLTNFLSSMREQPGLTGQDILLSVTTISFDIAALELYLPLIVGAQIVLVPLKETSDGLQLLSKMTESGATVMQATPATWRLLLSSGWKSSPHLKILCGGEALSRELADQLLEKADVVWNLYGPTETTIWSSLWKVDEQCVAANSKYIAVSIGRPIANTQFYLLDKYLNPVPIGVSGELFLGGDGLSGGYLHRSGLTAEKFIANPFSTEPGSRLYKTGDLARYLPGGEIEYLGRIDHQVKIRGFRIELGEIESVLAKHSHVREAVVIAREDMPGVKRLVAYVVPPQGFEPDLSDLRAFLKETLPDYMVPASFICLESLPLTPNGKVDRKALPAPDGTRPELKGAYVAPRTSVEKTLAGIWSQVVGIERVGIHDNFFDIGGNSLLIFQVHNRIHQVFGAKLSAVELFKYPTVSAVANQMQQQEQKVLPIRLERTTKRHDQKAAVRSKSRLRQRHRSDV